MKTYSRRDVETHSLHGYHGPQLPAVNVKLYADIRREPLPLSLCYVCDCKTLGHGPEGPHDSREVKTDSRFTHAWIAANVTDEEHEAAFAACAETWWEDAQDFAGECFPASVYGKVKVYGAGRSGGWCVVTGLPDLDSWDARTLGRWRRFERWCHRFTRERGGATYWILDFLYSNVFEPRAEENARLAANEE